MSQFLRNVCEIIRTEISPVFPHFPHPQMEQNCQNCKCAFLTNVATQNISILSIELNRIELMILLGKYCI